eukprot:scaffold43050_cov37-Tisochrysis_lutea.AAC.2
MPPDLAESSPPSLEIWRIPGNGKEIDYLCYVPSAKLLVSCDAVQNYVPECMSSGGCKMSCGGKWMFPMMGFKGELITPPMFFKLFGVDKKAMLALYAEVMTRDFDTIICGHGPPATGHVKDRWSTALAANANLKGV